MGQKLFNFIYWVKVTDKFAFGQVNGNQVFTAYADENKSNHEMARNSGLVGLDVGDIVRIEILGGRLDGGWQKSTFSGFLIYENMY